LILQQLIDQIPKINGIVAYSIFQLPANKENRLQIINRVLDRKGELHFALENIIISGSSEITRVENIWLVRQTLPSCKDYITDDNRV
jgi:sporadic carbohydrate cluster protein (TIGR04323 family)